MRVLLINRNDFVDGGADRVFLNTVEVLKSVEVEGACPGLDPGLKGCRGLPRTGSGVEGLEVDTFSRSNLTSINERNPRELSFFNKLSLAFSYLYNRKVAKALEIKLREFRPDVAHIHLIFGTLSLSVLRVLKKHNIPMVMTVHDYRLVCPANAMLDRHGRVCERCEGRKYYKCLVHRCSEGNVFFSGVIMLEAYLRKYVTKPIKLIDHFIFVSQFAQSKHIQFDPRFKMKSSHLYNMSKEEVPPENVRGTYFLFFGRLSAEKGVQTLVEAAEKMGTRDSGLGTHFLIVGSGPLEDELTNNFKLKTKNLKFLGFQEGEALEKLIKESSFVVVPSEWYENNPMTIVEAFSLGKPVIGAKIGGIPELVNDETGFLFESGNVDALVEATKKAEKLSNEEYKNMSNACYQFYLNNFQKQQHVENLLELYKNISKN